jgi:signal transduction histidine kinase/DNA-binding response OmpR family regulator
MENKIKIVIIDDDLTDRMAVVRAARLSGFNVDITECDSAESALTGCMVNSPDLMFVDVNLPGISGMELLQKTVSEYPHILCVMMTGQGDESMAVQCIKAGAFDYIPKSLISSDHIGNILKNAWRIRHAESKTEVVQHSLRQSQMLISKIICSLPAVLFTIDNRGIFRIVEGNPEGLIPFSSDFLNHKSIYDLQDSFPVCLAAFSKALAGEPSQSLMEINGRTLELHYFIHESDSVCGIILDKTQEKQKQEELLTQIKDSNELQKLKETFLANMSHEIRTPIHGIINLAGILLGTPLNSDQIRFIEAIKDSADNLNVIINDILDLSKIQADKMTFEKAPFSVKTVINTLKEIFNPAAAKKGITFSTEVDACIPELLTGDAVRFAQVLNNLAGNAVKFTDKGQVTVHVSCSESNEKYLMLQVSVSDTGIGIPADKIHKIFDSFTQAGDDITRKYGGTGLGLNICKELIERQGGQIRVQSEPGKGSVFTFNLPFEIHPLQPENEKIVLSSAAQEPDYKPLHLLVVEDNDVNRIVITKYLKDWNFTYDCASDGLTALELIERNHYDVILLDVEMPGMKGYDVVKYIRKELKMDHQPVVAMTAHANKEEEQKCLQAGMNDYISKPFNPDDLKLIIYSAIGKRKEEEHQRITALRVTDLAYLREMSDGNEEFFREFITLFMQNAPVSLNEIDEGIRNQDWEKVRQASHKLKPSLSYVGMKEMNAKAAMMEEYAKTKSNLDLIPGLADEIRKACEQAITELETEIQTIQTK